MPWDYSRLSIPELNAFITALNRIGKERAAAVRR